MKTTSEKQHRNTEYNKHVFWATSTARFANYGFQQGGRDNKVDFPPAAPTIDRYFYMDDLFKSVDSSQAAVTCYREMVEKWGSNCLEVVKLSRRTID